MRYLGGKSKIAKRLAAVMLEAVDPAVHTTYLEPFVGGGAVFAEMAPHFQHSIAADAHEDLILMWQAVKDGRVPPDTLTEAEYQDLRNAEPSALRGFAGFGCSFGGKWFGGYARSAGQDNTAESARSVRRQSAAFVGSEVLLSDYRDFTPDRRTVVYCDPPYADTTGYATGDFDTSEFWDTMRTWVDDGALVFVSELSAPPPWFSCWAKDRPVHLALSERYDTVTENLWRCPRPVEAWRRLK